MGKNHASQYANFGSLRNTNKQHLELSHKKIIFASDYYKGKINETNKLIRVSTRKHRYIDGY